MGYGATISFKISPDHYAVVKAMAAGGVRGDGSGGGGGAGPEGGRGGIG